MKPKTVSVRTRLAHCSRAVRPRRCAQPIRTRAIAGGSSDETASLGEVVGPSFSYDAITKSICFQPTITPEKFKAFFSAGSCWGTFEQKSTWRGGFEAVLQLSYGCLTLNTLAIVPEGLKGAPEKVDVQINGERVQTDVAKSGKQFTFRFLELVELVDGDRIRVSMK